MSRARWAHIYRDEPDRLHTAMSFEQVADEASFVIGPVLAVLVSTLWFPEAGLLLAELLFTTGMLVFLAARATEPPIVPHADRPAGIAARRPGLLIVTTALVMTGVIFGANEVIAVAYATERGETGFSSIILGAFALGSTLAGIVFGSTVFRIDDDPPAAARGDRRCSCSRCPALLVGGLWPLVVVMFVAGSATAPMLITSLSLAQRLVPAALVTEGMAVAITGILIGISGGSAVGGWAIEAWGAQTAYAVPVVAGGLALAHHRPALPARRAPRARGRRRRWSAEPGPGAHDPHDLERLVEVHEVGAPARLDAHRRRRARAGGRAWPSPPRPRRRAGSPATVTA